MDYSVARNFNALYIILDIIWLGIFAWILYRRKKHSAIVVGFLAGLLYAIVDYGIFYHFLGTRKVIGANAFWLLFWLSMSYGFTNFAWIWLLLDNDGNDLEWSLIPIIGWVTVSLLSQNFGGSFTEISITRQVESYHGVMALILTIGYLILILHNTKQPTEERRIPIKRLLIIGVGVQLAWETALLITGIRPMGFKPIILNSLLETNLGLPYTYFIHRWYRAGKDK
jgi:hypothetical protein